MPAAGVEGFGVVVAGWVVAGWVVAGWVAAGCVAAGCVAAGCVAAGCVAAGWVVWSVGVPASGLPRSFRTLRTTGSRTASATATRTMISAVQKRHPRLEEAARFFFFMPSSDHRSV